MKYIVNTKGRGCDISLNFDQALPGKHLKTLVYDLDSKRVLLERNDFTPDNEPHKILKLPNTGRKTVIEVYDEQLGPNSMGVDKSFHTTAHKMPLKTYNVRLGSGDKEFMEFASKFLMNLPNIEADGKLRRSPSGKFKIVLFDKIRTYKGQVYPSPCMVGIKTGTMEVSKHYMMQMTHSQGMAMLAHEFGHFYKNPLVKLPRKSEYGADLNGMAVYLGSGYSLSEYINGFKKVFKNANTELNDSRYKVMKGFARKIYNGDYFGQPYNL